MLPEHSKKMSAANTVSNAVSAANREGSYREIQVSFWQDYLSVLPAMSHLKIFSGPPEPSGFCSLYFT